MRIAHTENCGIHHAVCFDPAQCMLQTLVLNSTAILTNRVVKRGTSYFILRQDSDEVLEGPFDSEGEATRRLGQIESFRRNARHRVTLRGGQYFVIAPDGSVAAGPFTTKAQAEAKEAELLGAGGSVRRNENQFSTITFNLDSPRMRFDTLEGRQYMVVPMVMLTEGVHAGSSGPLFYPGSELGKTPAVWNHKPIVVYHPQINGKGVSACDPDILNNRKIGLILNTRHSPPKLHSEAWLDVARTKKIDNRILVALEKGEMIELSTGLFTDNERTEGEFNGKAYTAIARNYRPDHLAILPDQKGACSIQDGAGLLRVNTSSHGETRQLLNAALKESRVISVFDKQVVFEQDGKIHKQDYTINGGVVVLEGTQEQVIQNQVTEFRTLDGTFIGNKEKTHMNKAEFILALIANTAWTEDDRSLLETMSEEQLKRAGTIQNVDDPNADDAAKKKADETAAAKAAEAGTEAGIAAAAKAKVAETLAANKAKTADEYINNAPEGLRDMLAIGLRAHQNEKTKVIDAITANERCSFTKEQLEGKDLGELHQIAQLLPQVANATPTTNFGMLADALSRSGGTGTGSNPNVANEEPLPATPALTFDKS